tara:strand:+ start:150 stop:323 length:174 start_codon:yes stop_codon:yes gene_type:complete
MMRKGIGPYSLGAVKGGCGCPQQKHSCDCDNSPTKLAPIVAAVAPVVAGKVMDKVLG